MAELWQGPHQGLGWAVGWAGLCWAGLGSAGLAWLGWAQVCGLQKALAEVRPQLRTSFSGASPWLSQGSADIFLRISFHRS